jgi:hypothetical protein
MKTLIKNLLTKRSNIPLVDTITYKKVKEFETNIIHLHIVLNSEEELLQVLIPEFNHYAHVSSMTIGDPRLLLNCYIANIQSENYCQFAPEKDNKETFIHFSRHDIKSVHHYQIPAKAVITYDERKRVYKDGKESITIHGEPEVDIKEI